MAKLIRSTQASYRKRRFLALYGDVPYQLKVTDYQNNIMHIVQCASANEAQMIYQWNDMEWLAWLPTEQTNPQTRILIPKS